MRSDYNKDFDKKIKNKFDEFLPEVSSSLWDEIEKEIKKEVSISHKSMNSNLVHSDSIDLDKAGSQINSPTVSSDPELKKTDQKLRKIDRSFKLKSLTGLAASLLIIGFSIWKFQPEEKVFLKGSESLVKKAGSGVMGIDSGNLSTQSESGSSQPITHNQPGDDAVLNAASKINGIETQKESPFEASTFAETKKSLKEAPTVRLGTELRQISSVSTFKPTTLSKNKNNKVTSSAPSTQSRLESGVLESLDDRELTSQNQKLGLNTPNGKKVSGDPNFGEQDANVLNTANIGNDSRLSSTISSASILNEEQNLSETESKEKQKIVSSVLNFLANNLQIGGDKVVEFSETENGIIKVDLKGIFARNNR